MKLENIISDRDLMRNEYEYKGMFADLQIHAKDNHRLLLERVEGMPGNYKVWGNYLSDKDGSFEHKKIYRGIQLDLFYD